MLLLSLVAVSILTSNQSISGKNQNKGKAPAAITIDVMPKIAMTNPYKRVTFRVRLRITEHSDNRIWSYFATCGAEIKSSQRPVERTVYEWLDEITVLETCFFQGCVHRVVGGKVKNLCATQDVTVPP